MVCSTVDKDENMNYRKAYESDINAIAAIYEHTHDAEEAGLTTIGWIRSIYPKRETALAALERGDLYVAVASAEEMCEAQRGDKFKRLMVSDGICIATAIINQLQVDVYADVDWSYAASDDEVLVLHTLAVDPAYRKCGCGRDFVAFYEKLAAEMGCKALRMDTNERNAIARRFYAGIGYREAGIVPTVFNGIPGVNLVMLEKAV